jgi:hypothetical protein
VLTRQQEADAYRAQQDYLRAEQDKLREKLPTWNDPKVRESESRMAAEYLISLGYSNDELSMLQDHRALLAVLDAARFRAQQQVKQKQVAPQPAKPVPPGVRNPAPQTPDRAVELRRKALRSPTADNQLAYMLARTQKD